MYGHALDLVPKCSCGGPAFICDDETDELFCARCSLTRQVHAASEGATR